MMLLLGDKTPTPEEVRYYYGLDLRALGVAVENCRLRPVRQFPIGPTGEEDGREAEFQEGVGPNAWKWVREKGVGDDVQILVIRGNLPAGDWQIAENYLGATHPDHEGSVEPERHYFGPHRAPHCVPLPAA